MKRPRHKLSSTDGIDYIQKQKSVKVNTEHLGDIDRFPFPNGLLVMPVKDIKALMADLKRVYAAVDEQTALSKLDRFDAKWSSKYPKIAISWWANWANLSTYFKYPEAVRTLIYTTNTIEGFNRQLRKVTKNKSVFPTDDSLLKMLYLAMIDITKKWTGKRKDWGQIHSQLEIFFADRLPQ